MNNLAKVLGRHDGHYNEVGIVEDAPDDLAIK